MRANPTVGGVATTIALATLVTLANAGSLPEGHTSIGVAKLMAKKSGSPAHLGHSVALFVAAPAEKIEGAALPDVPTWIELIPAPRDGVDHVETRDWRSGFTCDPKAIVAAFNEEPENRRAKPLDWEHKGHSNWMSDHNPAAGWIEELKVGEDKESVWGRIEWTDIGRDDVLNKRYRYISPVVAIRWPIDSEGNIDWDGIPEATKLIDAALTNNPATYIRDLARTPLEDSDDEDDSENSARASGALAASYETPRPPGRGDSDKKTMLTKEALTALGLFDNATEDQISAAVLSRPAPVTAPTPAVDPKFEAQIEASLAAANKQIAELQASKATSDAAVLSTKVEVVLSDMAREMRFTPAEREDLVTLGAEIGPDRLRAMLSKRPSLAHLSQEAGKGERTPKDPLALTEVELETATKLGLSPDQMRKSKAVMTTDKGRFSAGFISQTVRPQGDEDDSEAA